MKEPSRKGIPASSCPCSAPCLLPSATPCHTTRPQCHQCLSLLPASPGGCFQTKKTIFLTIFVTILPDAGHTLLGEIANKGFSWINQNGVGFLHFFRKRSVQTQV